MSSRTKTPPHPNANIDPDSPERIDPPERIKEPVDTSRDSIQAGGSRAPRHSRSSGHTHNVVPAVAAFEGPARSRYFDDPTKQRISSKSSQAELGGQPKVVDARPDAQTGLNHSSRKVEK
jgi:hypothetical protein